jgi:hypothetical protein
MREDNMANAQDETGIIYILTTPSFPNYQKIGKTTNVKERLRSLNDKSCLPFSFRVYATYEIDSNLSMVEAEIHKIIDTVDDSLRAREETDGGKLREREFFAIDKEKAFAVFESIAKLRGDIDKLKLASPTKQERVEETIAKEIEEVAEKKKGDLFSFSRKGIKVGDAITFIENNDLTATVVNDRQVEYQGKRYYLSPLAQKLLHETNGRAANAPTRGAIYFTYNGVVLTELPDAE